MERTDLKPSDDDLILAARRGDAEAFSQLVVRYKERAYRAAFAMVRDPDEAMDLTQEAFIKAHCSLKRFRGNSAFYTWLYRILVNLSLDAKRRKGRRKEESYEAALETGPVVPEDDHERSDPTPRAALEERETEAMVQAAIEALPEHHRTAVLLREVQDLSYQEIAEVMNCSVGTVMSRLHYARAALREKLGPILRT